MERVWEYPRSPAVVPCRRRVRVELAGEVLAESTHALRVSHPPTIYIPPADVRRTFLNERQTRPTRCEFKGTARYLDAIVDGRQFIAVGWCYPHPAPEYEALGDHVAFTRDASTPPGWTTNGSTRRRATSTAAGSPPT